MPAQSGIDWMLQGEPFVQYRTLRDILGCADEDPAVAQARRGMLANPRIVALIAELSAWPGKVIASHKSAGQLFHKLTFLADLGLRADDPGVGAIVSAVLSHQSDEGPFQLSVNIAEHYGGSGTDTWGWALCDAPLSVYALARMGLAENPQVRAAADHLAGLARENGWPCAVSEELGGFRGPGRKADPCPFATLAMLKALGEFDDLHDSEATHIGAETLLALWADSRERHPYMFYMGTDFRKLKAPFVWYDLLHVLHVLSQFEWLADDARIADMRTTLVAKADNDGLYTAESVWTAWKGWEFAQKKEPSRWITLCAWRIVAA